jgi:hypothetical protein
LYRQSEGTIQRHAEAETRSGVRLIAKRRRSMKLGERTTFLCDFDIQPGDHALFQAGDKFYLGVVQDSDRGMLSLKSIGEFTSLEEAKEALARASRLVIELVKQALDEDELEGCVFDPIGFAHYFAEHDTEAVREAWRIYDEIRHDGKKLEDFI